MKILATLLSLLPLVAPINQRLPGLVNSISCLDEEGSPIDSWTIIKAPQTADLYVYAGPNQSLEESSYNLNDTSSGALSHTLKQLWLEDTSYVLFNDEPPFSTSYNYTVGHTKGLLALEENGEGFWITHSIPAFPSGPKTSSSYTGLLSNAWTYAQNIFCISLTASSINRISYAWLLTVPNVYDYRLSDEIKTNYKNITALTQNKYSTSSICSYFSITTIGGQSLTVFSKSTQWNKDLWSSCVAPALKQDLLVESWIRGSAIGPSCTSSYTVTDVQGVDFSKGELTVPLSWSEVNDHSKWATSVDGIFSCFGDINRMTTQYARGGGAFCYESYYNLEQTITKESACN